MNRQEVIQILAMASVIDPRVSRKTDAEKSAMANAWCEILDHEMPFDFAVTALKNHYKISTDALMPADLQKPWRIEKRNRLEKEHTARMLDIPRGTKMPDSVRAKLQEIGVIRP